MIIGQYKKNIIIALTVIILIALFWLIVTVPLMKKIIIDSQALIKEDQKINNLTKKTLAIKESEEFYQSQKENIDRIGKIFVNASAPIEFVASLEKSAEASNVAIEISPYGQIAPKAKDLSIMPSLSFQLIISGSASNSLEFLNRLENSPYLMNIKSVNIVRDAENKAAGETNSPVYGVKTTIIISVFTGAKQ